MYVYLASRDKKGVKIIASFDYSSVVYPTRVASESIPSLNMDSSMEAMVSREALENRMQYELYMETAKSFDDLKSSLAKRGYSRIPSHKISPVVNRGRINGTMLIKENNTMIRRGSFR